MPSREDPASSSAATDARYDPTLPLAGDHPFVGHLPQKQEPTRLPNIPPSQPLEKSPLLQTGQRLRNQEHSGLNPQTNDSVEIHQTKARCTPVQVVADTGREMDMGSPEAGASPVAQRARIHSFRDADMPHVLTLTEGVLENILTNFGTDAPRE
ncbi:hypothetical protein C0993_009417 [Termitomyces sp. T159_Od127]|nr:hypothetical protein C0993_009417 [Termitomyces sp. T159_Od127]